MSWADDAACIGHGDLFFPATGERPEAGEVREARAARFCARCPVIEQCGAEAESFAARASLDIPLGGFWGGRSYDAPIRDRRRTRAAESRERVRIRNLEADRDAFLAFLRAS